MNFGSSYFLWALLLLPALMVLYYISWRHYRRFERSRAIQSLQISRRPSWKIRCFWGGMKIIAFVLVILALTEPTVLCPFLENKYDNVRIIFVVDVSNSMLY